jgi:hypothetical protein
MSTMSSEAEAPTYRYNPHLGSPRDAYRRIDIRTSRLHHPELAGRFTAYVDGETVITSALGRRQLVWRAEPGQQCVILGYWSDGTVHVKWEVGYRTLDGRFPAWVVEEDKTARMAGGGRWLAASTPLPISAGVSPGLIRNIVLVLVLVTLILLPPVREALTAGLAGLLAR